MENITVDTKIKEWYTNEYPHDTNASKMNSNITFKDFRDKVWTNYDVYDLMGVECDTMRARLFKQVAFLRNVPYQHIENEWIWSDY